MWRKERCNVLFFCGVKVFLAGPACGGFGRLCRFAAKGEGGGRNTIVGGVGHRASVGGGTDGGWMTWYTLGLRVGLSNCLSLARWPIDRSKSGILLLSPGRGLDGLFFFTKKLSQIERFPADGAYEYLTLAMHLKDPW